MYKHYTINIEVLHNIAVDIEVILYSKAVNMTQGFPVTRTQEQNTFQTTFFQPTLRTVAPSTWELLYLD